MSIKTINDTLLWFNSEMKYLIKQIEEAKNLEGYGELQWPLHHGQYHKTDLIQTANLLAKPYGDKESVCCLESLEEFSDPDKDLDYFFMRLHIIGHLILDDLVTLNMDDLEDVAFAEVVCSFFATLAVRHYYRIEHFTPNMALQIAYCLHDEGSIMKNKTEKYSALDKTSTMTTMFNVLLKNETQLLQ